MKILIADDSATVRRLLQALLAKWGYEVLAVPDGTEACKVLEAPGAPPLALIDWTMPGMSGIDLCRHISQRKAQNPPYLILLTAHTTREDMICGLRSGADDYVKKPVDAHELRARLNIGARVVKLREALAQRIRELEEERQHVRILQGLISICMHCHRIRDDKEIWQRLESYIETHSEAAFSHSLCPECLEKYYPEQEESAGEG